MIFAIFKRGIFRMKNNTSLDNNNRCICCGEVIAEGRQVCHSCETTLANDKNLKAVKSRKKFSFFNERNLKSKV